MERIAMAHQRKIIKFHSPPNVAPFHLQGARGVSNNDDGSEKFAFLVCIYVYYIYIHTYIYHVYMTHIYIHNQYMIELGNVHHDM